jgi:hypothetical protein
VVMPRCGEGNVNEAQGQYRHLSERLVWNSRTMTTITCQLTHRLVRDPTSFQICQDSSSSPTRHQCCKAQYHRLNTG